MRRGRHHLLLAAAVLLLAPAASRGDVYGTANADVIVYGRVHHWAWSIGGGGSWRYDGEGGCVFEYDAYNSPTYRGAYDYHDDDLRYGTWYVYGGAGNDHIYSPSLHDGGSLQCSLLSKVDTDTVNKYETRIHGDDGSSSSGGGDTIDGCPSWHCKIWGNGGVDDIVGGSAGDTIYGEDGVDEIHGGAGGDTIRGGIGNDWLYGDAGVDTIYGDAGDDHLYGGDDGDYLYGGDNYDYCYGNNGTDYCGTSSPYYCEYTNSCSSGGL